MTRVAAAAISRDEAAMSQLSDYTLELSFTKPCGEGKHPVSLTLTAWGTTTATSLCDLLPETARRIAGSTCRGSLDSLQEELQHQLLSCLFGNEDVTLPRYLFHDDWGSPPEGNSVAKRIAAKAEAFIKRWRGQLEKLATYLLRQGLNGRAVTTEELQAALAAPDVQFRWAAAITAGIRRDTALIPILLRLTEDPELIIQAAAIWALTETAGLETLSTLERRILDRRLIPPVRKKLAFRLAGTADRYAIELLVDGAREDCDVINLGSRGARVVWPLLLGLKYGDRYLRYNAAAGLAEVGAPAVQPLIALLNYEDWRVRQKAVEALKRIGDRRAIEPLKEAMKAAAWQVRWASIEALIQLGAPRFELLIKGLKDKHRSVRAEAAAQLCATKDLGALKDPTLAPVLVEALNYPAVGVPPQAEEALVHMGASAVEPLLEAMTDKERGWKMAGILTQIGKPAVPALIRALKHENKHIRGNAVRILRRIGDARAVEPFRQALRDPDRSVRQAAREALQRSFSADSDGDN
jgi:HEAT repeat protein